MTRYFFKRIDKIIKTHIISFSLGNFRNYESYIYKSYKVVFKRQPFIHLRLFFLYGMINFGLRSNLIGYIIIRYVSYFDRVKISKINYLNSVLIQNNALEIIIYPETKYLNSAN